jgi:ketosteroid isomerase-like protein
MSPAPIDTAKPTFSAFSRGDIPAIFACLAPDAQWEYGPVSQNVPWYQNRHGVEGATEFFQSLAACEFHQFDTTAFIAGGDTVVVLVDSDYTVKKTGKRVVYEDAVFLLKFNADGKIAEFAHRVDLHQAWLAYNDKGAA